MKEARTNQIVVLCKRCRSPFITQHFLTADESNSMDCSNDSFCKILGLNVVVFLIHENSAVAILKTDKS